jgi:hypothetical protein
MNSLEQHLADTAAYLNAQLCELNELRERARRALLAKPEQPKPWNGLGAISEMDREAGLGQHWKE